MIDFNGKTILITGAGGGIGAAAANLFHKAGARLVLTDLSEAVLEPTVQALTSQGASPDSFLATPLDISDASACATVVATAAARFSGIDSVVNCAGIYIYREGLLVDLTPRQWQKMISINFDGCFHLCQAVIPHLNDDSAIVLVSSVAASRGSHMHSSYAAAKSGVVGLSRSLALELAPKTRVNCISPGLINTPMASAMVAHRGDAVKEAIPLKRFGEPEEAASVIAFLCSRMASYVNGETINVNGGMYID
jgi:3-oxoacyl-[acyl-carrier protein] reductase